MRGLGVFFWFRVILNDQGAPEGSRTTEGSKINKIFRNLDPSLRLRSGRALRSG